MQLWISRQSDTSIREQLATQVVLAIVSGELAPGQRLPSTRELARRFRLHPNTVSAGYRQLERDGWLQSRKGSGVYVHERRPDNNGDNLELDQLIARFFQSARRLNAPLATVRSRLKQWIDMQPPDHFLLIEPDTQLAEIVATEMRAAVSIPVRTVPALGSKRLPAGAIPAMLSMSAKRVRAASLCHADVLTLNLRSARKSLAPFLPISNSILIGIASAWPPFLKNARTLLISAGFHPDCLLMRDTNKPGWRRRLKDAAAIVCDSLTKAKLAGYSRVLTFPLLALTSVDELQGYEQFIRDPLRA